jgi:hypothetical protein
VCETASDTRIVSNRAILRFLKSRAREGKISTIEPTRRDNPVRLSQPIEISLVTRTNLVERTARAQRRGENHQNLTWEAIMTCGTTTAFVLLKCAE